MLSRIAHLLTCLLGIHHWDHWIHTRSCTHCHTTQYRNHNIWSAIYRSNTHRPPSFPNASIGNPSAHTTTTEATHGRII